jgi:hypothetical protein
VKFNDGNWGNDSKPEVKMEQEIKMEQVGLDFLIVVDASRCKSEITYASPLQLILTITLL